MYREQLEKIVKEQNIEDLKILNEILEQFKNGDVYDFSKLKSLQEHTRILVMAALSEKYLEPTTNFIFQRESDPIINQKTFAEILSSYGHNFDNRKLNTYYKRGKIPAADLTINGTPYWYKSTAENYALSLEDDNFYPQKVDLSNITHIDSQALYIVKNEPLNDK